MQRVVPMRLPIAAARPFIFAVVIAIVCSSSSAAAQSAAGSIGPPWLHGAADEAASGNATYILGNASNNATSVPGLLGEVGNTTSQNTSAANDQAALAWDQATKTIISPIENPFTTDGPPEVTPPGVEARVRDTDNMQLAMMTPPWSPPTTVQDTKPPTAPPPTPHATPAAVHPAPQADPGSTFDKPEESLTLAPESEGDQAFTGSGMPPSIWIGIAVVSGAALALPLFSAHVRRWPVAIWTLFSHVPREKVFRNESRFQICQTIRDNPGICAEDVRRLTSLSRSTVSHHLEILQRHHIVRTEKDGRMHHLYVRDEPLTEEARQALAALRHPRSRCIATFISSNPGANQKQICQELAIPASRAHDFLRRLIGTGLVEALQEGRQKRYFPGPQAVHLD